MDYEQIESSQRQHFEVIEHQERLNLIMQQQEYGLFALLKPKLYIDGNEWCCLLGDDIQSGVCGFGVTAHKAILDWNNQFHKPIQND